ncbi:hypothetical protein LTR36_011001 [Oleoguttula mirabilis]|uniref:Uncharacterized protein n=1 Tax=Oleoguttula mirabilis TaxID=1507867 RepID=A0AAV9J3C3_9PEZI|nr:hypothetical protein LTR36_011001 [Oleoguttula mirabilis]
MLLSGFASPRRLALLAIVVFVLAIIYMQATSYSEYLPKYDIPGFSSSKDGEPKSSLEEDQKQPGRVETPAEEGLKVPELKASSGSSSAISVQTTTIKESGGDSWRIGGTSTPSAEAVATSTKLPTHSPSPSPSPSPSASDIPVSNTTTVDAPAALPHESYESVQLKVQELIKDWTPPPDGDHWPSYDGYHDKDYDPNRWEGFAWDNDFYLQTGIRKLKEEANVAPEAYMPYPAYNTPAWQKQWQGEYMPCEGARGKLLNESDEDIVKAYPILPDGFPSVAIGDANATGIDLNHCFDRYHRYGPYGFGQGERDYVDNWQRPVTKPDWSGVRWGQLQDQCLVANKERYAPTARQPVALAPGKDLPKDDKHVQIAEERTDAQQAKHHHRTALLIRTWEGYDYTENDLQAIRALITELSLLSGGEYQVFLFVNVKDKNADIFHNQQVYDDIVKLNVPRELQGIAVLWNEKICEEWYPKVGDWQVYWHQFMPLQWFSKTHPEFDFVWNWETDARYTGNHYHFLEAIAEFSKKTPRKYMWERNQRFYLPAAHGTYSQWLNDTDRTIERGMREGTVTPIWGPQPFNPAVQTPFGPPPPHPMPEDDFHWGVGEEADLITLQPIWSPTHTAWTFRDKLWNYISGVRPHFTPADPLDEALHHPDFATIPRRTYINTLSRFSRRQLHAMHVENTAGRTTQAEMFPATVALQHGLKAVYAPHPIWTDRAWPAWYADAVFNADAGQAAQWGQQADSVYNHDREHNFAGWSWYYQSAFPKALYRRWLGWSHDDASPLGNVAGKSFEEGGVIADLGDPMEPGGVEVGGMGRMCLPAMLLHPVKKVREGEV